MATMAHRGVDREPTFDFGRTDAEERLAELIVYVAEKCASDPYFGATKLNKILWATDMISYARYGQPVTGVAYQRLDAGPAPKRLLPVKRKLLEEGQIFEVRRQIGRLTQKRIVPTRNADLERFSGRDIAMVDEAIDIFCGKTAVETSDMSHKRAWHVAGPGGLIPYEAVFLSDEPVTDYDIDRTQELNHRFHWE